MFRKALSRHIDQLTKRTEGGDAAQIDRQLSKLRDLLAVTSDGRFRRSLNSQIERLEQDKKGGADTGDIRRRLEMLRKVYVELKDHAEYQARRGRRIPRK
ncbi:MAG TPA: hypothetical protein VHW65_09080 [Gemmatimonadales bacterium]|nr:hypothetical protein [Gemmatimonadales bacterium]